MHIKLHRLAFSSEKATRIVEIPHEKERLDEPGSRNPFVRDKDRILYSKPFRRCLLYTSDAADDLLCVDLGGRRIIKKKNKDKK